MPPSAEVLVGLLKGVGFLALVSILYADLEQRLGRRPLAWPLTCGVLFGAGALIAMVQPITVAPGVYIDARSVILALTASMAGPLAALIAAGMAGAYRLWLGGVGAPAGLSAIVLSTVAGIAFASVVKRRRVRLGSRHMVLLGLLAGMAQIVSAAWLPWDTMLTALRTTGLEVMSMGLLGTTFLGTLLLRERRRLEGARALRENEARYRLLAENVSDVIVRVSLDGVRTYCSGAVHDVFGYGPEELVGRSFMAQVHPDDRRAAGALFGRLTPDSPRGTGTFQMQHKDGRWVWTEASARLITDMRDGEPLEFVFVIRDIADRKRMEEDLEEARRTAERANQSKSNFLAGLSHELRTPLNAIIGFADLIAREAFGPAGDRQYVQFGSDIRDSGQHLLGLINEILDHAKAEAGRLRLDEDTMDLSAAVRFCTRMITARAERSGVSISHSVAPDAQYVRADEKRVRQILLNLLTNAVKYTPSGGHVTVAVALDQGAPTIIVSDTGIGIDEKDVPRVLQAFEQVENPANRQLTGTGLGLPLTRHLVELHGGQLVLSSRVGEGSTITVRLPAERLCRAAGMDGQVLKPIERIGLLAAVSAAAAGAAYALDREDGDLPVLDEFILDELRESLSDRSCAELIDDFLRCAPERMEALRAAADDMAAVDRKAHALVSYAGNVGLRMLPARCRQLCAAAHAGDAPAVHALLATVEDAAVEGIAHLQTYRASVPIPS